jgi:glucose/arabinose dehydrogenase
MPTFREASAVALLCAALLGCSRGEAAQASSAGDALPPGFTIEPYASGVSGARQMAMSPAGTLFVGSRTGQVYAIPDRDRDGRGDEVIRVVQGLTEPHGVAVRDGALYVAEQSRLLRFDRIETTLAAPPAPVTIAPLPNDAHHGRKAIGFGPDGKLYVSIGAPCNVCDMDARGYGQIRRVPAGGGSWEVVARGVRDSVGFDFHPVTGELWFTDNGRDWLGDDRPPDELNRVGEVGQHFGFPFCHGRSLVDPEFGSPQRPCSRFAPPVQELGPHVAALGMAFYTGTMFPAEYRHQVFIAEHGSWNRSQKIGYRVTLVRLDAGGRALEYRPFADVWRNGEQVSGRPVDVQVAPDGALLISDDQAGVIHRISYRQPGAS